MKQLKILYEDAEIFVIVKPAGMPSEPERSTVMDAVSSLKNVLAARDHRRDPYIGVVHRLDRPVGGVMVYAKTPQAAAALSRQFARHETGKEYLAVVHGTFGEKSGRLVNDLMKDTRNNYTRAQELQAEDRESGAYQRTQKNAHGKNLQGTKRAELSFDVLDCARYEEEVYSLLRIHLRTGRHHQIRVQMSYAGHPVAGDHKYGKADGFSSPGLYACRLVFIHPDTHQRMQFSAVPEGGSFGIFSDALAKMEFYT